MKKNYNYNKPVEEEVKIEDLLAEAEEETIIEEKPVVKKVKTAPKAHSVRVTWNGGLNVRAAADIKSEILRVLPYETVVKITDEKINGFGKLKDEEGWISLQFTQEV